MAMTVAVKEAVVVAVAIAITFSHCNISIIKDISNCRTTIFSSEYIDLLSVKNHSKKFTLTYTPTKTFTVIQQVENERFLV